MHHPISNLTIVLSEIHIINIHYERSDFDMMYHVDFDNLMLYKCTIQQLCQIPLSNALIRAV